MLLSFSIPAMRPMIEAGLRQRACVDVGNAQVKRQTIRRIGARASRLLERAEQDEWRCPYALHLWWKSRTPQRAHIATIPEREAWACPITIWHGKRRDFDHEGSGQCVGFEVTSPGVSMVAVWEPGTASAIHNPASVDAFARKDGFSSVEQFRDFFVPRTGDTFDGVIFIW